jgi:flagellar hook assembly protein FlgD
VRRLVDAVLPAGEHEARWDGTDDAGRSVAAGVYLVHAESPVGAGRGKIMLVR